MTEEQKKKSQWLNRAFYAEKKVKAFKALRERDRERAKGLTNSGEKVDKGKSDSRSNSTENAMLLLAQSDHKYNEALAEYIKTREEIESAIKHLNSELQAIAIYRYIYGMGIERIAEEINYSVETVKRRIREIIDKIKIDTF